ncbi:MAG TPA: helix-turn-helix transcriptional regulator [Streptosporangiaceae bacterium]
MGVLIRQAREARGLSQDELADRLMGASGSVTLSRNYISRWENGKRGVSAHWLPHLADVLDLPLEQLRDAVMKRRAFLAASSVALFGAGAAELLAAVATGDDSALCRNIAPYDFSVSLAALAARDLGVRRRLVGWMHDGHTSLLRGNCQGTLFKTRRPDLIELAEMSMARDEQTRKRCMRCFTRRAFGLAWPDASAYSAWNAPKHEIARLTVLLTDPADASNRWCAAVYLGQAAQAGWLPARRVLGDALRTESSRENLRTIGLVLSGEQPWR